MKGVAELCDVASRAATQGYDGVLTACIRGLKELLDDSEIDLPAEDFFRVLTLAKTARQDNLENQARLRIHRLLEAMDAAEPIVATLLLAESTDDCLKNLAVYHLLWIDIPLESPLLTRFEHRFAILVARFNLSRWLGQFLEGPPLFTHVCETAVECQASWEVGWKAGVRNLYPTMEVMQTFGTVTVISTIAQCAVGNGMDERCLDLGFDAALDCGKGLIEKITKYLTAESRSEGSGSAD